MKKQGRLKLLIENFIVYGGSASLNKIIPFVMLPIVTRTLNSTTEYGIYEVFNTIISLGGTMAVLGMVGTAVFKEYFEIPDDEMRQKAVVSSAAVFVFCSSLVVGITIVIFSNPLAAIFYGSREYSGYVRFAAVAVIISGNNSVWKNMIRLKNNRKLYVIQGILQSFLYYAVALSLLFAGLKAPALMIGETLGILLVFITSWLYSRRQVSIRLFDWQLVRKMLEIGVLLMATGAIYWIFNSMDKIMITHILGLDYAGIYGIGLKVAMVSQLVYSAFAGGWQYFSFSTMKDSDQVDLTSRILQMLSMLSAVAFLCSLLVYKEVFGLLFEGDYVNGATVFPFLMLSPLILMLFQSVANQLIIISKSGYVSLILFTGAVTNVVLNATLIPVLGIQGAAIATLSGYMVSLFIICVVLVKRKLLYIKRSSIVTVVLVVLPMPFIVMGNSMMCKITAIFSLVMVLMVHKREFGELVRVIRG